MNKLDILQNFKSDLLKLEPFPYFEIKNAVPKKIYQELKKDFYIFENIFNSDNNIKKNNVRLQINSEAIFNNEEKFKSNIWYDFVSYHTSKEFFNRLIEIFGDQIYKIYPHTKLLIEKNKNKKNFLNYRSLENLNKFDFVSDCQPGINTPVEYLSSVRGPHVDNPVELIGGLFYLRDEDDKSDGGDLLIYDTDEKIYFKNKAEVENIKNLKLVQTIKYSANQCVFFLNSKKSIHAVTARTKTQYKRYLTNIIIERYNNNNKFFKLDRKYNLIKKIFNKILNSKK